MVVRMVCTEHELGCLEVEQGSVNPTTLVCFSIFLRLTGGCDLTRDKRHTINFSLRAGRLFIVVLIDWEGGVASVSHESTPHYSRLLLTK